MKIIQYRYPFESKTIQVPQMNEKKYTHIGIQMPYQQLPFIKYIKNEGEYPHIDFIINDISYVMNQKSVLEFADIYINSFIIDLSYIWDDKDILKRTIIDIGYVEEEV